MRQDNEVEHLAERLLQVDKTKHGHYGYVPFNRDGREAAALLRTQAARIAELESEVREMAMQAISDGSQAQEAYAAQRKAEANVTRLETALAQMQDTLDRLTTERDARILAALEPSPSLSAALALPEVRALVDAATPYVSPVQNADFARQLRQHDALVAALAAMKGGGE